MAQSSIFVKGKPYEQHLVLMALFGVDQESAIQKVRELYESKYPFLTWDAKTNMIRNNPNASYQLLIRPEQAVTFLENCWFATIRSTKKELEGKPLYRPKHRIAELRKARNLTQRKLSEIAGVYPRLVQKLERDEIDIGKVPYNHILLLAHALHVTPEELIVGRD